jgi:hypothetical protein
MLKIVSIKTCHGHELHVWRNGALVPLAELLAEWKRKREENAPLLLVRESTALSVTADTSQ